MIYPSDFEAKLGFNDIRAHIVSLCVSKMGIKEVEEMSFSSDHTVVCRLLNEVHEMTGILRRGGFQTIENIVDILPDLGRLKMPGSYLSGEGLLRLLTMIGIMHEARGFFSETGEDGTPVTPHLAEVVASLGSFNEISAEIGRVVNRFGEVKDSASPRLAEIRREKNAAAGSVSRIMNRILSSAVADGIVESGVAPSVRDGRLVIPVAAGLKKRINGIVHDESATGKTVFIEPSAVVEASNKVRELEMEENREIVAILLALSEIIRPYADELAQNSLLLGRLDFIRAKARYAILIDAQMPVIEKNCEIDWYHAVHPVLLLNFRKQKREVIPLNLQLDSQQRILVISGPNAGGKSVCLKTVGVVQYMIQCGLLPTVYSNSHAGIFESIFIDIGDQQSMENDLSTYSSHLKNMKFFVQNANGKTIILADEIGSGTEPQIGGALAQAVLHKLAMSGCLGVVTTHYQNLKTFAEETPGILNGAMLYDRQHLRPMFQLSVGSPGSSFALEIARNIGLSHEIIEEAKSLVGSDYVNMDKYLLDISRDKRYWANKRQNIKEKEAKLDQLLEKYENTSADLKSQRAEILREAKREAKEIMQTANAKLEKAIRDIRNVEAEKEQTKKIRQELEEYKKSLADEDNRDNELPKLLKPLRHRSRSSEEKRKKVAENNSNTTQAPLQPGEYVRMTDGGVVGKILSLSGKKAEVAFGALRTFVPMDKLVSAKPPKPELSSGVSVLTSSTDAQSRQRQLNFKQEIDVRGMRADEAIQAVTYFIDDALQFSASKLRILHGTGHGILKTLIRQQLKANPVVKSFYDEDVRFGGAGITIVDLE